MISHIIISFSEVEIFTCSIVKRSFHSQIQNTFQTLFSLFGLRYPAVDVLYKTASYLELKTNFSQPGSQPCSSQFLEAKLDGKIADWPSARNVTMTIHKILLSQAAVEYLSRDPNKVQDLLVPDKINMELLIV